VKEICPSARGGSLRQKKIMFPPRAEAPFSETLPFRPRRKVAPEKFHTSARGGKPFLIGVSEKAIYFQQKNSFIDKKSLIF